MMKFYSILFVLFALNGCSRADLISDLLNSLQQQQPNLNQLTNDLSGLSQFLQQNGNTLTSLAQLLQQQQSGTSLSSLTSLLQLLQNGGSLTSFEQQLSQLSQLGQQTLNSLPFSVTNLTNILSNINWDQFLANVTAQFNALQSQLNSAQSIEQSLAQFQALLNSTGLGTIFNQILSSSQFSALTNLLPSINQTVLMQYLNQTNQLTNIITLFANGSYEQAIPQLFQFLNITPYLDQINNVAQQLLNYQNISNDFNATQIQFATLSAIFQNHTNMTAQQIFLGLLQQDNVTLACLTSIATNQAAYDACAKFTNQTAYTALLDNLKAFNVTIDGVAASFSQLFTDLQVYFNNTSNAISSFNVTDMYNRAIAALTSFFSPNIFITNPPASTTTTTTSTTRTTTNSATSFVYHYPLFSLLLPSLITVSTWAFYF